MTVKGKKYIIFLGKRSVCDNFYNWGKIMKRLVGIQLFQILMLFMSYLNAEDRAVRVFFPEHGDNPIAVDRLQEGLIVLDLENDTLEDFDIDVFTDRGAIRAAWGRDLRPQDIALMGIFRENFDNYVQHHRGSYTGRVKIYETTECLKNPTIQHATIFEVCELDTLVAAQNLLKNRPAVLNMADDITPGGFLNAGGHAQEESISYRAHDMVIALMRAKQAVYGDIWHNVYRKTEHGPKFIQEEGAIYIPQVKVIRAPFNGAHYEPLAEADQFSIDIIASVSYDLRWSGGKNIPANFEMITKEKIRAQLRVALDNGHTTVLLSAFGCGAHHNDPTLISNYYKAIFNEPEFKGAFQKVVFSILGKENFNIFHNCFDGYTYDQKVSTKALCIAGAGIGTLLVGGDFLIRKDRSFLQRFINRFFLKNKKNPQLSDQEQIASSAEISLPA